MRRVVHMSPVRNGYELRLTQSQNWLIVNSVHAFREIVTDEAERELVLGVSADASLDALLGGESTQSGGRVMLTCSATGLHCLYSLLVNLPLLIPSEEVFHRRLGVYRENLLNMASGVRIGIARSSAERNFGSLRQL